ncbi:tRNA (uridine(54)-C5)-methyltransferase TrmA [Alishewanella tabrizica]|uniref:tRNA/tmRNA (uracil-C(5))-methyltransferase n=1 Tax=Alishewanella tabrizica TaxID=671278 RepID=A0ABQ2WU61_9ALTE|nr:tRNA (uridine(54)-C5)-methyltransferase TrmA [Alishewanella tabrizica]GGW68425.1 tRNA/tmRNA (uracil-C(5))-methyltransferase [Alishewanella tabrizica]
MSIGQVHPSQYETQLAEKANRLSQLLIGVTSKTPELFRSQDAHFRQRAEFRIWHDGDDIYHAMFDPETRKPVRIDYFPVACKLIADFMPVLLQHIQFNHTLRYKLYQVDYLATTTGELLISMIYKHKLDESWINAATELTQKLRPIVNVRFIGRSRKQKVVISDDFVIENFTVNQQVLHYQQVESSFTQPNAGVNQLMLNWAARAAQSLQGDLLELYCGNGNFSLALAPYFNRIIATELARSSIKSAEYNISLNNITNVDVLQMSAEDVASAFKEGNHLKHLDLNALKLNTVLVDPPRAGLDPATLALVSQFDDIIYISCNPETLATNLATLAVTHDVADLALFDQFPYTHHIETGIWLRKRNV